MTTFPYPPLALYIHTPWCVRKCPYCDFNSHESADLPEAAYLQALLADLTFELAQTPPRPLVSIFIGGGTPSLLSGAFYQTLLDAVRDQCELAPDCEITLEANPGTVEQSRFMAYRAAGINRLSLGVQSFQAPHLERLGRIHGGDEAIAAVSAAQAAGFERINIDLMHGLPQQTAEEAMADLQQAIALGTEHISWYQLTIEPNTTFYSKPPRLPVETELDAIETQGFEWLAKHDWVHYETSAFARQPAARSRHNLNYWLFGDYLAIGAGAHGKRSDPSSGSILRYRKTRLPADYLRQPPARATTLMPVSKGEHALEFFMNAFRLHQPIPRSLLSERAFVPEATVRPALERAIATGLLSETADEWQTTPLGQRFLNTLLDYF